MTGISQILPNKFSKKKRNKKGTHLNTGDGFVRWLRIGTGGVTQAIYIR